MKTSEKAKDIMKNMESLALKPYDDQKAGTTPITSYVKGATIGYGHLISESDFNKYKKGITKEQADALFDSDLLPFEIAVEKTITKVLKQHEFDALVMLAFNIGVGAFSTSSVAKIINNVKTSYSSLQSAWAAWNKSQGKVMKGLVKRRELEYKLYSTGIYKYFI